VARRGRDGPWEVHPLDVPIGAGGDLAQRENDENEDAVDDDGDRDAEVGHDASRRTRKQNVQVARVSAQRPRQNAQRQ
jgi:hypothetical protein